MAKDKTTRERLLVVGNPVVATGDARLQLSGELSDEQYEQLGEAKVSSLRAAGHLRTEQEAREDEERQAARRGAARTAHDEINPNYGTPSMTPEAMAGATGEPQPTVVIPPAEGLAGDRPVDDLDVSPATRDALRAGGFATVGDVLAFGAEHGGLAGKVDGIGDAREKEIQAAIDKLDS